jgi:hypothetical protein
MKELTFEEQQERLKRHPLARQRSCGHWSIVPVAESVRRAVKPWLLSRAQTPKSTAA